MSLQSADGNTQREQRHRALARRIGQTAASPWESSPVFGVPPVARSVSAPSAFGTAGLVQTPEEHYILFSPKPCVCSASQRLCGGRSPPSRVRTAHGLAPPEAEWRW